MSLTPREAFKYGFLGRCVEEGMSLPEAHQQVKLAIDKMAGLSFMIEKPMGAGVDAVKGLGKAVWSAGIPAALAIPPVLGGLAGYGLARATDINDKDEKEVKSDELKDEYARQTELLLRTKALRDARMKRKRSGRLLA